MPPKLGAPVARWRTTLGSVVAAVAPLVVLTSSVPLPDPVPLDPVPVAMTTTPAPAPAAVKAKPPKRSSSSYKKALTRSLEDLPGRFAVSAHDLTTGRSYTYNRGLRTATASIVKVDIVMALLLRAQRQRRGLSSWERRAAARAIKVSDNAAASALWSAIGGASGLAAANKKFGLRDTRPGPGGAWGATTTSAADQVRLLTALTSRKSPLSAKNRRYVLGLMSDVAPEQSWGVSASGRKGAEVALKNGWLPREWHGGLWTVNSIGQVRDRGHTYLIAVISERHGSMGAGVKTVERVSRLVTKAMSRAAS
ncbi:beta-lactamase class A [Nonomuraea polychroma]|uniref:Beta-lactamase class A n=1 Tax=Nonomuraea polychroma TaxID=46176 RepID=A0A438MBV9_9ACTN|nr:serine hydrolase [Nonomuraea polychroma]RVX43219.1 beta-lactamase class A [Nonomuraea polychroma]